MVNLKLKKRLVARLMGVGLDRVWLDPESLDELEEVDTRRDIKELMGKGVIKISPVRGQRTNRRLKYRKGPGKRKGGKKARLSKKKIWTMNVRAQRALLRRLKENSTINKSQYRKLYMWVKGAMFRSKSHLMEYIKTRFLKEDTSK